MVETPIGEKVASTAPASMLGIILAGMERELFRRIYSGAMKAKARNCPNKTGEEFRAGIIQKP